MDKKQFFLAAMGSECYRRTAWVITAFSLVREGPDDWKKDPYPYRIVQTPTGHFFVDPQNKDTLVQLDGTVGGEPAFKFKDQLPLAAGEVPNLGKDVVSTYGTLLANYILLIYPFGKKISYANGKIKESKLSDLILSKLESNPKPGEPRRDDVIYVDERMKYSDAVFYMVGFTQLCVPACSEKSTTAPEGIVEYRQSLIAEYTPEQLKDPAVIAVIEAKLVQYIRDSMKGDSAEGFLIKDKSYVTVRKKLYGTGGGERGMDDKIEVDFVQNSLSEGMDLNNFHILATASRSGSFSRGAQTELGGEAVKWLFRASSNLAVVEGDCGSQMGLEFFALPGEEKKLLGFTALIGNDKVKITKDNIGEYMGKKLILRSPMFCHFTKTDFCATCLGDQLSANPTGLSTAVADYGSKFMYIFMSAMHSNALQLAPLDIRTAFR